MYDELAELKNSILRALEVEADPEVGLNLLGLASAINRASLNDIEPALRELLLEGKIAYWGEDNLDEDGRLAAFVLVEPGWVADVLEEIDGLPEVP